MTQYGCYISLSLSLCSLYFKLETVSVFEKMDFYFGNKRQVQSLESSYCPVHTHSKSLKYHRLFLILLLSQCLHLTGCGARINKNTFTVSQCVVTQVTPSCQHSVNHPFL